MDKKKFKNLPFSPNPQNILTLNLPRETLIIFGIGNFVIYSSESLRKKLVGKTF